MAIARSSIPTLAQLRKEAAEHETAMLQAKANGDTERAATEYAMVNTLRTAGDRMACELARQLRQEYVVVRR